MTEIKLKYSLGVFMIVAHLSILLYTFILFSMHAFTFSQLTTLMAVITPMLAGYTASIISFIVKDKYGLDQDAKRVTPVFAGLSFLLPATFLCVIAGAITLQAYSMAFDNFDDFKAALVLIEGAFAVYVGRFVTSLFDVAGSHPTPKADRVEAGP